MLSSEMHSIIAAHFLELLAGTECGEDAEVIFKLTRPNLVAVKDIKFLNPIREDLFQFSLNEGALRTFRKFFPKA